MSLFLILFLIAPTLSLAKNEQLQSLIEAPIPSSLSIEELLQLREKIRQSVANSGPQISSNLTTAATIKQNKVFFAAQRIRLEQEIREEQKIAEGPGYKEWEKEASKEKIKDKMETLEILKDIDLDKVTKSLQCLSDIKGVAESLSPKVKRWAQHTTRVYSKGNPQSTEFLGPTNIRNMYERYQLTTGDKPQMPALSGESMQTAMAQLDTLMSNSLDGNINMRTDQKVGADRINSQVGKTYEELLSPEERANLKEFGVQKWSPSSSCKDLSYLYSTPKLQAPKTAKCAGYAIANDMEAVLNNKLLSKGNAHKTVSAEYAYTAILSPSDSKPQTDRPLCNLIGTYVDPTEGVVSIASAINKLQRTSVCSTNANLEIHNKKPDEYIVSSYKSVTFKEKPSINFFLALLDNGITPMVTLSKEARAEREDWIYPNPKLGDYKHVVNLVGYCSAREANCLNEVDYFIIRDSLGKKSMHYKVPAHTFLSMSLSADKITGVKSK